ncbi:MAG: DNA methyltransferase [Oculatellaceae cyanobacterium bins.114]|nr:DNA methyltransferase [Oculatellaceae cyanobacterium bins.114]
MPSSDSKSLFHAKTLINALRNFQFPADIDNKHQVILRWIQTLDSGTLSSIKEVSLHGAFLNDIFQTVLGYRSVTQGNGANWEIHAEPSIVGRGAADAALGFFAPSDRQIIAPIELKGAMTDLDRGKSRNQLSPVDQGWSYADYIPGCQWVIVSNYRETRLYHRNETKAYYERFLLADLSDREVFKRFYYLLCRQNFLPFKGGASATSVIDRLLKESKEAQEDITDQLYRDYSEIRQLLVNDFIRTQQIAPQQELLMIEKAQKLLDRILFIAFCEDRGLLPKDTLKDAYEAKNPYNPQPIWKNYTALFSWIDQGNGDRQPPIPGYNGGLFQRDLILDEQITVPDLRCEKLKNLTRYDFDTEVSVDILGHIFEQSITDLEKLKAEKTGQEYGKQDEKKGKRKTQGIYYTPAWVTQYIVEAALGGYLKQQEQRIHQQLADYVERSPQLSHTDPANGLSVEFWQTYQQALNTIRVIDPACGSGAFLIAAFDYLMQEHERVNRHLEELGVEAQDLANIDRTLLTQNLFGVDLSSESVEITKLSLWLKTAVPGKTLTDLDHNIKVGNSIVADASVTERAFD